MAHKDIFKIDNYLISIGATFLVIGVLFTVFDPSLYYDVTLLEDKHYTYEDYNGRTLEQIQAEHPNAELSVKSFPLARVILAGNGLLLLAIGVSYRRKENKIIRIWDALDRTGEARVNDLAVSLGLSRDFVLRSLKSINAQRNVYFVYDSTQDKIVDGKLMTEYAVSSTCTSCGNANNYKISLSFAALPSCKYCGTPIGVDELNDLKHKVLSTRDTSRPVPTNDFKVGIFVLLLIFFWPAAIAYLIIKKQKAARQVQLEPASDSA